MNLLNRWPLHPAPLEGEALSAWLDRVAKCYEMDLDDLLLYEWGKKRISDLDIRPPDGFLEIIAQRSGVELDQLRCMTLVGWVPWFLDSFNLEDDAFNCYINQLSVLLPQKNRPNRSVPRWRAWLPKETIKRACPTCLNEFSRKDVFKLLWQFPLFISCPTHGCWLESVNCYTDRLYGSGDEQLLPRQASTAIRKMDQRTEQAFITGQVELPRRKIHAGLWFRLLRTLIEELNTPQHYGIQSRTLRIIWERAGHPFRAGLRHWYPFEILDVQMQLQFLEAASMAIHMIESEEISAQGTFANLFLPERESITYQGSRQPTTNQNSDVENVNHMQLAQEELKKLIALAHSDPKVAEKLFHFILLGRHDHKVVQEIQHLLSAVGVPVEWCQINKI